MAAFDYATAAPLMDAVNEKWMNYSNFSQEVGGQLVKSAILPWLDVEGADATTTDMTAAIKALSDYIATLAPE